MMDTFKQHIVQLLQKAGLPEGVVLSVPTNPEMGDFSLPCFALAKEWKISPAEAAQRVVNMLEKSEAEKDELLQDFSVAGPYVNFYLKLSKLAEVVLTSVKNEGDQFGHSKAGEGRKVLIEYPSQNTHKEFHIGHLRNVCIGNTLVQLYRSQGYDIVPVNYINDFGAHVVKCLWGIQKFHATETPPSHKQRWLGHVYAEASNYIKEHEDETKGELDDLQKKLEARDPGIWPLFETTREWSLSGFKQLEAELGATPERVFLESEVKDLGQQVVTKLLDEKVAMVGEKGAIIIDLKEYNLDIALLRKSTGAGVYMTSDLALAEKKFQDFPVEESINITGIEQNFYFKQLFKVLELHGFKKKMTHIGYGLVNRSDGKMSSRLGNVILYEELRDEVAKRLWQESATRHPDWSQEKLTALTKTMTLAVLKFTMLQHEAAKNVTFDINQAVSVEGYSAPYVLYVIARINSLIKKSAQSIQGSQENQAEIDYRLFESPAEKKLLTLVAQYGEVLQKALLAYNPSVVVKYAFDLAQAFNNFYAHQEILAPDKAEAAVRIALCIAVKQVLTNAMATLTIQVVEEM